MHAQERMRVKTALKNILFIVIFENATDAQTNTGYICDNL